ncbi:hypothetical protein ACFU6I_37925 [Streptomyces sp. NPDC057486]
MPTPAESTSTSLAQRLTGRARTAWPQLGPTGESQLVAAFAISSLI